MDCVIEILLKDTDPGTVERKVGQIMDLAADGFKGRSREDFTASAETQAAVEAMDGGTARVLVHKIG